MSRAIGLLGCGRWGRNILRDLRSLGCAVHVCDPDEGARAAAVDHGAASAQANPQRLPDGLDGYVIASPARTHVEAVRAVLPRGRPVFCEKPLATDAASAHALAREAGGPLFVMDKWRYHPGIEKLAELTRRGDLGAVQQVRTRRLQWGHAHADVDPVWTLLPHDLSIVHHVLGHLPVARAAVGDFSGQRLDGLTALLGERPGAVIEVSARSTQTQRRVSVSFERGIAWLADPMDDHVALWRGRQPATHGEPDVERVAIDTEWPLLRELRRFVGHLEGGPAPHTAAAVAAEHIEAIERLRALAGADA